MSWKSFSVPKIIISAAMVILCLILEYPKVWYNYAFLLNNNAFVLMYTVLRIDFTAAQYMVINTISFLLIILSLVYMAVILLDLKKNKIVWLLIVGIIIIGTFSAAKYIVYAEDTVLFPKAVSTLNSSLEKGFDMCGDLKSEELASLCYRNYMQFKAQQIRKEVYTGGNVTSYSYEKLMSAFLQATSELCEKTRGNRYLVPMCNDSIKRLEDELNESQMINMANSLPEVKEKFEQYPNITPVSQTIGICPNGFYTSQETEDSQKCISEGVRGNWHGYFYGYKNDSLAGSHILDVKIRVYISANRSIVINSTEITLKS